MDNNMACIIMQVDGGWGRQHQWQSEVWVNEEYQTIYQTIFGHIPAQPHFLDSALLELAVSISVIGCGSIARMETLDLGLAAGVSAAL